MSDKRELNIQLNVGQQVPDIQIGFAKESPEIGVSIGEAGGSLTRNYEKLRNLPQINSVVLIGDKTNKELRIVLVDTRENWDKQRSFIPEAGQIILYSDYYGEERPAAKIGDGDAYLVDLPVVGEGFAKSVEQALVEHVNNGIIHVTKAEKDFWNAKLNYNITGETLSLNRE